tara:strand:+ start:608 stop:715 length:108 start_codon:yes stop_codon:yes gene_type:complete
MFAGLAIDQDYHAKSHRMILIIGLTMSLAIAERFD